MQCRKRAHWRWLGLGSCCACVDCGSGACMADGVVTVEEHIFVNSLVGKDWVPGSVDIVGMAVDRD